MNRYIFLDVETTGLYSEYNDRIIEIGCVEVINGFITGRVYHSYYNPETEIKKSAYAIHGINNEFLKNKKLFSNKINNLISFISNSILVAHNAKFDIKFLNKELLISNFYVNNIRNLCYVLDSLYIVRKLFPRKNNSLSGLCRKLKIIKKRPILHSALDDAYLLALSIIKIGFFKKDFELFKNEYN